MRIAPVGRARTSAAVTALLTVGVVAACTSGDGDTADEATTTTTTAIGGPPAADPTTGGDGTGVTRQQVDAAVPMIDGFVEALLESSGVPGLAVAVVHDDEVVFARGYGVREVGTQDRVSADTVFQIASLSKPVTGTAVAALVSDGVIDWDEPVYPYAPDLVFSDPYVTDHVTFADLYSHRSGLPGDIGDVLEAIGYSRGEILARLRFVPLAPFRASYGYTNFGMTAGGDAAAKAAGISFEELVEQRLLEPAGMTSSTARYADFEARPDRSAIHVRIDGEWVRGPTRVPDAQAPAGGISSSVNDLARWLRLQLGGGTLDGVEIVSEEALGPTHTPHIVVGPADTYDAATPTYGLGWQVVEDHLGRLRWAHSGAFSSGAATNATLLPGDDLGVVVLTNGMPIGVPEALVDQILDQIVIGAPSRNWATYWTDHFGTLYGEDPALSTPPDPSTTALDEDAYLGAYSNDFYGTFDVVADGDGIAVVEGPARVSFPLTHWDANTFTFVGGPLPDERTTIEFTIGPDGRASALTVPDANGLGTLRRIPTTSTTAPPAPLTGVYEAGDCPNPIIDGVPTLDLGADFECGYLTVPENRSVPDGATVRLAVARARAVSPTPRPDPIVYLGGGPGNSGLASAVGLVTDGWNAERDVIVLEQRGTLKSEPLLACPELDTYLDQSVSLAPTRPEAAAQQQAAVQACRDRLAGEGWDLSAYNTTENAADVADLRVAMGIDEWNLYGVSYGTDLALQTLRHHPDGIRTVVLDSVLPPQVNLVTDGWPNAAISYRALFDACAAQPACATAYPDVEGAFHSLVTELTEQPRRITTTDPATGAPIEVVIDGYTLANLVLVRMTPGAIADLPALVHELDTGDGTLAAAALLATRPPVGLGGWGLNFGVVCREQAPFTDPARVMAQAAQAFPDFPEAVLARIPHLFTPLQNCDAWDVPAAPPWVGAPVGSDVPVLVLAGGLDPITPTSWAEIAAAGLSSSQFVIAPAAGHDVLIWEVECGTQVMRDFLDAPDQRVDAGCLTAAPIPPFTIG